MQESDFDNISHVNSCNTDIIRDSLLRVFPKSEKDQSFLQKFDQLNINAQVWGLPLNPNVPVYMYVKAGAMHRVEKALQGRNVTFSVLIEDIQG